FDRNSGIYKKLSLLTIKKKSLTIVKDFFLNYFSTQACFQKLGAGRSQLVDRSCFYGTLSFIVDDQRALFGLFGCVVANTYQRFNHMIESIDIVIVDDNLIVDCNVFL